MIEKAKRRRTSVWREWKGALRHQFPGQGRTESFLERLGSSTMISREEHRLIQSSLPGSRRHLFRPVHPVLHWPAVRLLHVMGWWHYRIQRDACREGSRICWQADHWRNGELGPLAADLVRQLDEHNERRSQTAASLDAERGQHDPDAGGEQS